MISTDIKQKFNSLPVAYQKTIKWVLIACIVIILYTIIFFILKGVLINKAKNIMVSQGLGSSPQGIKLDVGLNPFNWWTGKVSYLYVFVDTVNVERTVIIHDLEVKTRKVDIKRLNQGDFTGPISAQIYCKLNENDFLTMLQDRLSQSGAFASGITLSSRLGMIYVNTGYPLNSEYSAEPYLQNNCIYIKVNQGYLSLLPIKVIDFGAATKNRLNVYSFQYVNGAFELKGNVV